MTQDVMRRAVSNALADVGTRQREASRSRNANGFDAFSNAMRQTASVGLAAPTAPRNRQPTPPAPTVGAQNHPLSNWMQAMRGES
jgi:hypothetical protein